MIDYNFFYFLFSSLIINIILFNLYINFANRFNILDRSNNFHNPTTITSGGIIIFLNLLLGYFFLQLSYEDFNQALPNNIIWTFVGLTILFIISLIDDLKPINPKIKLVFQIIVIYFSLTSLKITQIELPLKVSIFLFCVSWVYITNIINFIDGVDGFASTQLIFIFFNLILINYFMDIKNFSNYLSLILIPPLIIFFYFNKPNAKIYLGDAGSIILGFIVGYVILDLIILKQYLLAISLIIYPLTDCTITLIKRVLNKNLPWVKKEDYFFSKLQVLDIMNKTYIFRVNILFCILNSFFILLQILIDEYFFMLNIFLTIVTIFIYNNKKFI
jgi:UDP-GlcNAc:undecaprenyl-phosphate/decaprenyl-phosphate GlcNAc-1-phosphate transferase